MPHVSDGICSMGALKNCHLDLSGDGRTDPLASPDIRRLSIFELWNADAEFGLDFLLWEGMSGRLPMRP